MNIGRDYLGGTKYQDAILKSHQPGVGGGFFWEEFGKAEQLIIKCSKKGITFMPFIRVQGLWAGSSHNYSNMFLKGESIAKELNNIAKDYPDIKFYYSPFCENNDCPEGYLLDLRAKYLKLLIVHTANKNKPLCSSKFIINETHGDYMPKDADAYSFDGLSSINTDIEMFKDAFKKCEYAMYWSSSDNGRKNDSPKPPPLPINQRVHWTSVKMNQSIFYQALNTRTECTLKKGTLSKSHADPDTPPNPREDNKLVILSDVHGDKCDLLKGSKVTASAKFAGNSHEDGRNIYRFNEWGYIIAKKSRNLTVRINGKNLGTIDPGFRVNEYRNKL